MGRKPLKLQNSRGHFKNSGAMTTTRTPYRISIFGGGTDCPDWYLKEVGALLSLTAINYFYITARYQAKTT